MSLFPEWRGVIELPALPDRRVKVGGNTVFQRVFPGLPTRARIAPSQFPNFDLVTTDLGEPFKQLLLRRKKRVRRPTTPLPIIRSPAMDDGASLPADFPIEWESLGELETYADTPEKVLQAWTNKFDFRTENEADGLPGMRTPQIGALHAISAHFAVGDSFEPATVVLPTGTGKTETMLATQIYRQLSRTLVLVPSDTLRSQIAGKFVGLGVLPKEAKVVPGEIARPRVGVISTGIRTVEEANSLLALANVIVALPNALEASAADAVDALTAGCSDLMVDEAHHITAKTWEKVRERFAKKRILQFTATPFRRDARKIDGKIIFNYKLGDAQAAGYYRPINLRTVEEYGDEDARDRAIAAAAIAALKRDRDELGKDHLLMARCWPTERAEEIVKIYRELAPELKPVIVYSGPGRTAANREAMEQLHDRGPDGARIVVCVDMLGEGYDLPNLKVAALHDTHKSLAITLQFIGRFTRKGDPEKIGEATVVTNIADPKAEQKLADLYAEGADWDGLIKRLSEERIEKELRLQDVVFGLRESGDLGSQLSLWNLRPALSCQFFKTKCAQWDPLQYKSVLPVSAESWHAYSETDETLVAVVCRAADVNWGSYQNVLDTIYDLVVLRWDKDAGVLALFASDYDALRSEKIAAAVTDEQTELVCGDAVFRILNNVDLPLVKSLGSSQKGEAISFTSYFGSNVTEGLMRIEKKQSSLNNLACLGYENGEKVLWGGAQRRGKIWQQKGGSIADWITWTQTTWAKVSSEEEPVTHILADFLRPIRLDKPHTSHPISVQWGENAQIRTNPQFVLFGSTEVPLYLTDVDLGEAEEGKPIPIVVCSGDLRADYRLEIDEALTGGYRYKHVSGAALQFKKNKTDQEPMEEYLRKDPFVVRYADGTSSYNCYHIPVDLEAGDFDPARLEAWDWSGIPLNKESMGKDQDRATIQYRAFERLADEFDFIFNDDGSGEAADLVCLKNLDDNTIRLTLVHCKGAYDARVSRDIRNFYVVCGQAQKSIGAKHSGLKKLADRLKRRHDTWARQGKTRLLKGNQKTLQLFVEKSRRAKLEFEMILIQPGGSVADISDGALKLLATTEAYLFKTTKAGFRVILSA